MSDDWQAWTLALCAVVLGSLVYLRRRPPIVHFDWACPPEAAYGWKGEQLAHPFIHETPGKVTAYDPATGCVLHRYTPAAPTSVTTQIDKAVAAAPAWRQTTFEQRRAVMRSLLAWCLREAEGISRVACRDSGKTSESVLLIDAAFGELLVTNEKLRWLIASGEAALKPGWRGTNLLLAHKTHQVIYEPLGVVAALVSWNYPFHNLLSPIIAALFAGNAIVVKPSELVTWSSEHYARAIRDCLAAHGHNPDIVQVIIAGEKEAAEALTGDERIAALTFIGSEGVGRQVAARAGAAGTQVTLELGGKDPALLLPSTDLNTFTRHFMRAAFQSGGQNCIGTERFIVHSSIYDRFLATVEPLVRDLRIGSVLNAPPSERVDMGAMVADTRFDELEKLIERAIGAGARCLVGGKRHHHSEFPHGHYFCPTLLVDVTPDMAIAQTELFAPVMLVMRYQTVDEGIAIANGTRYALGASVYGKSKRDCEYAIARLRAGMVAVNDFGVTYVNQALPFGGVGPSGYGRFGGPEGLRSLCSTKAVTRDRFHGLVQTSIPSLLAYPIKNARASWRMVAGLLHLAAGQSFGEQSAGLVELARAATTRL